MIIKRSIPKAFRSSISEGENAKKFIDEIEQYFAKNEKAETSNLLAKLISMKYKGKSNIREYIMEMSNLASKLKALKLELGEDLLVHLVLISLRAHFGQFKVSFNDKWSLNELISHCVQDEEGLQRGRSESAHLSSTTQNKKRKKTKGIVEGPSQQKKPKKDEEFTYYFCKKSRHMKKECPKYATWHVKKGKSLAFICFEVNLAFVPKDTWWVDFGATTHISVTMQGCLWSRLSSDDDRFIFVGDDKKVAVEAKGLKVNFGKNLGPKT